jgi:hypothetical protein
MGAEINGEKHEDILILLISNSEDANILSACL